MLVLSCKDAQCFIAHLYLSISAPFLFFRRGFLHEPETEQLEFVPPLPFTLRRKSISYSPSSSERLASMPAWAAERVSLPSIKAKKGGKKGKSTGKKKK